MTNGELMNLFANILSAIAGAVVAGIVSYYINKNKTNAEIDKLRAEIRKLNAETDQINAEVTSANESRLDGLSTAASYRLVNASEQVIYDSSIKGKYHPFVGTDGQFWSSRENKYIGPIGKGKLLFEDSKGGLILNVQRTNTEGRYGVMLKQYSYNGDEYDCIPKSDLIAGNRKIRIRCEAKVNMDKIEHTLVFILRDKATNVWLASKKEKVTKADEWRFIDIYFDVSPNADVQFRIDDQEVSKAPSGVQIRKLLLTEKNPKI